MEAKVGIELSFSAYSDELHTVEDERGFAACVLTSIIEETIVTPKTLKAFQLGEESIK